MAQQQPVQTHKTVGKPISVRLRDAFKRSKVQPTKKDYSSMENFITIDVKLYDGMTYEEGLKIAQDADNTNAEFQRYLNDAMGSVGKRAGANKMLKRHISMTEISGPVVSNVSLFNIHRQRIQLVPCNEYHNCMMYLILKGQSNNIVDKSIIDPVDYENIQHSQVIEPYQVIETARNLATSCGDDIEKYIKEHHNMGRYIFGIRSMAQITNSHNNGQHYQPYPHSQPHSHPAQQLHHSYPSAPQLHRSQSLYMNPVNAEQQQPRVSEPNLQHTSPYAAWGAELNECSSTYN